MKIQDRATRTVLALASLAVAGLLSGCMISYGPPRIVEETVSVTGSDALSIETQVGSISIQGAERSDLGVTMTVQQNIPGLLPGTVTPPESIALDVDDSAGVLLRHAPFNARGVSVSYEVEAPYTMQMDDISSDTGSIQVRDVAGNASLSSSTGSITAERVDGIVTAITSTGSITLRGCAGLGEISTSTGSVTADVLTAGDGVLMAPVSSDTGSIRLYINPALSLTIRAETGTGSISVHEDLNLSIVSSDDNDLDATMNGGGIVLDVETGTGSITLLPLEE